MKENHTILIKGARANNLKNIDVQIPTQQLVVITGVSGSGKSSLTIDTLYAEGQRRYVESLSSYARQFLMRMKKPEVDQIKGLCPAIAIEQKTGTKNARSTVGTLTEIYDYLRILYARLGRTFSPISSREVRRYSVTDIVEDIQRLDHNLKIHIFAPLSFLKQEPFQKKLSSLLKKGFTKIRLNGKLVKIAKLIEQNTKINREKDQFYLLIDRFMSKSPSKDYIDRLSDSIQSAYEIGKGQCILALSDERELHYSEQLELDGMRFSEPRPELFNFNNSLGACSTCEGYGRTLGVDERKVIPDFSLSLFEGAVACWKGEKLSKWKNRFVAQAHKFDFPVHRPYKDLTQEQRELLWKGNQYAYGIDDFFAELEEKAYKIQNRVLLARYRGQSVCSSCGGKRLKKEALYVRIGGKSIDELVVMPAVDLQAFLQGLTWSKSEETVAKRLLSELTMRLGFMLQIGLDYLCLDRLSSTLSGGETQRLNLTRTLGSNLTSSLYILDEPSVGLHPRDSHRLIQVLQHLRDLGNTVVVVEHEEDIIAQADYLIDIGPRAGVYGGELVFAGPYKEIHQRAAGSLTAEYMSGKRSIPLPQVRRAGRGMLHFRGLKQHNLKNIDVALPLETLTVVTGVSGSGKTTLVKKLIYPIVQEKLGESSKESIGDFREVDGDFKALTAVEFVSQQAIGKSSRSNPVTYVKAYDAIRRLFAHQQESIIKNLQPKHFSFNVEAGRCETCKGEGETTVSMQFLADIRLECEDCKGQRFQDKVLEVRYKGKNIHEVLSLSIEEAMTFFEGEKEILRKLKPLLDVGLGYVQLGQSSNTLSGGEAQRVKLAAFLQKEKKGEHKLFIFDEPTTGLHFDDIQKLLYALNALVERGNTVLVVEHNLELIKSADYLIDLGPEGGEEGGSLLFQGKPEELVEVKSSYTAQFLKEKLS